jgi:hypothetical protein
VVTVTDEATGAEVARLTRNCAMGELDVPMGSRQIFTWDENVELAVRLYSGHLSSKDDELVLAGANRLAVETDGGAWEVIAFAGAELVSPGLYRLTRLLRGQLGTGHAVGPAAAGRRVVVLDDRPLLVPVPLQWLGETRSLRAYAGRADAVGAAFAADLGLAPILPLAPVHLTGARATGNDDVVLGWLRRSRADTDSWAVSDAPLDHQPEAYVVTILNGAAVERTIETAVPGATYTAAQQSADFGGPPASFGYRVAQMSQALGPGHTTEGLFNG